MKDESRITHHSSDLPRHTAWLVKELLLGD